MARRFWRRTEAAVSAGLALLGATVVLLSCDGGGASDAAYDAYFRQVEAEMAAFDAEVGNIVSTQRGLDDEGLPASLGAYAGQLEFHATVLGEVDAPGETAEAHRKFVTAFRYLRDVKILQSDELIGIGSGLSDEELADRVDARSAEWFEVCHELQDVALAREIDVDLRCVTALHRER